MFVYFFVFLWQCSQLPWHKIFFCCFEINKYISKFVEKVTVKKFWKLSRIKHQQNVNKKMNPWSNIEQIIRYLILVLISIGNTPKSTQIKSWVPYTRRFCVISFNIKQKIEPHLAFAWIFRWGLSLSLIFWHNHTGRCERHLFSKFYFMYIKKKFFLLWSQIIHDNKYYNWHFWRKYWGVKFLCSESSRLRR